jgi:hypothetical protein
MAAERKIADRPKFKAKLRARGAWLLLTARFFAFCIREGAVFGYA